jgi:signal transduction histidine kinase
MSKKKITLGETIEKSSILVHKLKGPLATIKAYLEVLLSEDFGKINDKQKEYLRDISENLKIMIKTVDSISEVSRIEEEQYKIDTKAVDLKEITQESIDNFSFLVRASNSEVVFDRPNDLPLVLTDPVKIRQVINGLISNSLKYKRSGRGKILITLKKDGNNVLFSCKDNGIGIKKNDSQKIFSKFYRSKQALEIDTLGFGLGLYVSRAIVQLSGGKMWFKANKDHGVTFYFTLPIAKNEK